MLSLLFWLLVLFAVISLVRRFVPYGDAVVAVVVAGVLLKWLGVI